MDLSNPSITGIKLIFCHNPSSHAFRASEARPGIQEQRNWFPAFAGTMSGFPPSRSCRHVIARDGNDRSNLISSRIHEITTTPERRLVMTKKNYDTIFIQRKTTLPVLRRRRWRNAPEVERRSPCPLLLFLFSIHHHDDFLSTFFLKNDTNGEIKLAI